MVEVGTRHSHQTLFGLHAVIDESNWTAGMVHWTHDHSLFYLQAVLLGSSTFLMNWIWWSYSAIKNTWWHLRNRVIGVCLFCGHVTQTFMTFNKRVAHHLFIGYCQLICIIFDLTLSQQILTHGNLQGDKALFSVVAVVGGGGGGGVLDFAGKIDLTAFKHPYF